MVQSHKHWSCAYVSTLLQPMAEVRWACVHNPRVRRARHSRTQTAVRPSTVVMFYPNFQDPAQVRLRERNHPVNTLTPMRFLAALLLSLALPAAAATIEGRVVGVNDGDTITVLDHQNIQHRIRIA